MTKTFREISDSGRDFIKREEGSIPYAYDDAVFPTRPVKKGERVRGTLTIGVGHTGPDVAIGMKADAAQINEWLDEDLDMAERAVADYVKVPLTDNQHATLVSFAFSTGISAFRGSTLLNRLNRGDYEGVPVELARWNKTTINGKKVVSKGLTNRRAHEAALWSTPSGTTIKVEPVKTTEHSGAVIQTPAASGTATPTVPGSNWLQQMLNGIFGRRTETGDRIGGAQPIRRPLSDNINWAVLLTVLPVVLNFFGLNVPDIPEGVEQSIVAVLTGIGVVVTWIISTFFRKQ